MPRGSKSLLRTHSSDTFQLFITAAHLTFFLMKRLFYISLLLLAVAASSAAQYSEDPYKNEVRPVFGKPYKTRDIKVFLTDEETGGPYANKEVRIKYYWRWDVIKPTPQTEQMSNIRYFEVKATTNEKGFVLVPGYTIYPRRPELPGADASDPYFYSIGITAIDEKHSSGLAIFAIGYDLSDENEEVHRVVRLYPRPLKPRPSSRLYIRSPAPAPHRARLLSLE